MLLAGRYRLERQLGRGATGTTFSAVRISDGVIVAVKEMPLRESVKARELIAREVRVLRQLHHPQIPAHVDDLVIDAGKHASFYLVLEFIDGVDLSREMEGHRYEEREVLDILIGVLPVLNYLHRLSPPVIHRDVKPRNIMRRADGSLVLLDFGAVRDAVTDRDLGGSTVAGTFGYMAPEQFRGDAEPGTDIYALGALAVALLTRKEPHTLADPSGVLVWAHHARVSASVARLLGKMLERDLRRRPSDAAMLLEEVRRVRAALDRETAPVRLPDLPPDEGKPTKVTPLPFPEPLPFDAPVVHRPLAPVVRPARAGVLAGVTVLGVAGLLGGVLLLAGGLAMGGMLVTTRPASPVPFPIPETPAATCTIGAHDTQVSGPSSTSRFQVVGASEDGSTFAMAVGRQSDQRAELLVYEAGSRTQLLERVLAPGDVTSDWPTLLDRIVTPHLGEMTGLGVSTSNLPSPASWCASGSAVQIGDDTWTWRTFQESCLLGFGENTSFELCPPGSTDQSQCIVPPRLKVGCSSVEPKLVDVFTVGDAVWVVAERENRSTTPRFAGGVIFDGSQF